MHLTTQPYSIPGDPSILPFSKQGTIKDRKEHFEIHTLEWLSENFLLQEEAQVRSPWYEIIWVKTGKGTVKIDSSMHEVDSNAVYCFIPGQLKYYDISGEICGYRLSFSRDFLFIGGRNTRIVSWLDAFDTGMNAGIIEADQDMQEDMEEIVRKMQKEFANYFLLRSEILSGLLNILMIHFSRKLPADMNELVVSKDTALVRSFKTLLKQHFTTKKLVADYASDLCVTPNYLNRTVKKITGFTASHHIQQHIVLEAKRHAIHSDVSMKEVAYYLGFDNLAHFSKFFKNNCGMNFTNFKKGLALAS
jgi:AraC family transcriptional regulator, transcriptional activator of pobA